MTEHKHADILRAIADGKKMQAKDGDDWIDITGSTAINYLSVGGFVRITPETIVVNGVECPKDRKFDVDKQNYKVRIELSTTHGPITNLYFDTEEDARTVFDSLCKPFKEGV